MQNSLTGETNPQVTVCISSLRRLDKIVVLFPRRARRV